MNKFVHFSAAVLLVASSFGCAARQHLRAADAAANNGDMRSALYNYQRALAHQERLGRDEDFVAKLTFAESRVAYEDALRLQREGYFEAAIEKLELALRRDPGYREAAMFLAQVLPQASRQRYDSALEAADGGNLAMARTHLEAAAVYDSENPDVLAASASLSPDRLSPTTPGLADWRIGGEHAAEGQWLVALGRFEQAVRDNPNMLPARASRYVAGGKLDASRERTARGKQWLGDRQVGPAMAALQDALAIWPDNPDARLLLDEAREALAAAEERFVQANDLAAQREWDRAIAVVDAGLAIDRSHGGLSQMDQQLPTRAAEDATRTGQSHLRASELDEAQAAFRHALSYREDFEPARLGMAGVYEKWGDGYESDGRLGAALLHYRVGQSYLRTGDVNEGYTRNANAILAALGMGLSYDVAGLPGGDIDPRTVQNALAQSLNPAKRVGIAVGGNNRSFSIASRITTADIDQRRTDSHDQLYNYIVQEWQHNPHYDHVQRRYEDECRILDRLYGQYQREAGHHAHGHEHHDDARMQGLYNQIQRQQNTVNRTRRELENTPHQILVDVQYSWEYTVETYKKTGALVVQTDLIDNATGQVFETFKTSTGFEASDETILNPNPQIGLQADPLSLPGDSQVRGDMADQVAAAISDRAVNAVVQYRLGQLREQATALREQGLSAEALEVEVQAAVLLGMIDRRGMGGMLDRLGDQYTK